MPFFYWYQLAWVAGVAICTGIVYAATRNSVFFMRLTELELGGGCGFWDQVGGGGQSHGFG